LDEDAGATLTGYSLAEWHDRRLPRGSAQCVVVDLRGPELWSHLREMRETWKRLKGQPVPFIGIVDQGLPADRVVLAEQSLAAIVLAPVPATGWKKILGDAVVKERTRQVEQAGGCRMLHGGGRKFLTYTPSLFPLLDDLEVAARSDFTILLVGETGTGKTTFRSARRALLDRRLWFPPQRVDR
jgi:DNA-binding NtrC family response regulator